jgi:hypothetical protein
MSLESPDMPVRSQPHPRRAFIAAIRNIVEAVKAGLHSAAMASELKTLEARREVLMAEPR